LKFIAIEGNIGSGKSSLALQLKDHFSGELIPEEFEKNPFLELFYKNPSKFAFALENSFFLDRVRQLLGFDFKSDKIIFSDYIINKCLWFAEMNLSIAEYGQFKLNFEALQELFVNPDYLFVLHLPVLKLKENILKRGRVIENNIDVDYLEKLNSIYLEKPLNSDYQITHQPFIINFLLSVAKLSQQVI
jgi:deoxyguanosine kinase